MQMLYGMGILGIALVIILHLLVFNKNKKWLSWLVLILLAVATFFLGGKNTHGGVLCIVVFVVGAFWLWLYHNIILYLTKGKGILEYFKDLDI